MKRTHYAGALRIVRGSIVTKILAGYAACCSGRRAEAIRANGNHSHNRDEVDCLRCLDLISKEAP